MKRTIILISALVTIYTGGARAEEPVTPPTQNLDEVVVTATRTERKIEEIPAAVTIVTREALDNKPLLGLKEALSGIAGVQSESKNGGYDSRLIIRGAGLKARYGVREIMVLLDGVPITDPDGLSRFDFVDTQLVERIDVLKGPNSTLYGANAAGGVVNILTVNPYEERRSIRLGYGSNNTDISNLIYSQNFDNTSYLTLFGTRKSTDGWREWNRFDSTQTGLKYGRQIDAKTSVDFNFTFTDANLQLPGTLTKEQFDDNVRQRTTEPFRHGGRYSEIYHTSLKATTELSADLSYKPVIYYQNWSHIHPVPGVINDGGAEVYGTDQQLTAKHRLLGIDATLVTGATLQIDDSAGDKYAYRDYTTTTGDPATGRITATLSDRKGERIEEDADVVTKWGVYAQESLTLGDRWLVDAGARFDQVLFDLSAKIAKEYSYSAGNYVIPDETDLDLSKTYNYVSPRLGVVYRLTETVNLYGNISTGFQTPQSSELSTNQELDPAVTINYETGIKARTAAGDSIDLTLFTMKVSDEIIQTIAEGGVSTYSNAGETSKQGIELSAQTRPFKGLQLGGTYTYSDFTFAEFSEPVTTRSIDPVTGRPVFTTTNVERDGKHLPYIPENQYSLFAYYKHPSGFKTRIDTNTWGAYYMDNANSERYRGYSFLTSLMLGWEKGNWDIVVDISNVLNQHYAMEVSKDTSDKITYRPGAPISTFGKVTYKF